ncbi:MAG: inactive transglutaminase family protein [Spongiibacteraceae bacterium]|nr:inactive transglutaminase family protein [Spongiibacteraceae bacterium]
MSTKAQVYLIAASLFLLGLGLTAYKSFELGFPLMPGEYRTVWTIEAKVEFNATNEPVRASLALPRVQRHMRILDETFSAAGYGFQIDEQDGQYRAIWSRREASGPQRLFYKLSVYNRDGESIADLPPPPDRGAVDRSVLEAMLTQPVQAAMTALLAQARELSADGRTFVTQLITLLNDPANRDARLLLSYYDNASRAAVAVDLLTYGRVPAHLVRGIYLEDDRQALSPQELVEVFVDNRWVVVEPASARIGLPGNFFMWQRGGRSLLDVVGGRNSEVTFSVIANNISARTVALMQSAEDTVALVDFSIYSLPIEQQSIFKLILLVPVGTLAVIFLRVLVGLRTSGTFMPVLLALAFIQTQLLTGLTIFLLVLAVGLGIRSYLSRLNLLLVSRIAAVVVVVVLIMAAISVISYKLGIDQALTVTFFPMIILAWTIERMSILWEEDGIREVAIQVAGSLIVAICAFMLMTNRYIEHWTFNFPELMLCVLAVVLILGQYTGYRVSELMRFRHLER